MENKVSNTKRLAKNTVYMYLRMALLMVISLYTSRVVLNVLGVDDYGTYNVVGSIVMMFHSLRSIFSSATQRFLNYEMGKGNNEKLQLIFNLSNLVNLSLALIFVAAVEIVGVWFLNYKINIDPERLFAAKCVFQFSVLATVFQFLTVPYDACIIAHEKMNFYAYMGIVEGLLKLLIVFLLPIIPYDRLIVYGFLVLLVSVIVRLSNQTYCRLHFSECKFKWLWDKKYFKEMTSFAGWAFFGNTSYALCNSGMNMILNIFGGPVVNAARGIAYQVSSIITQITHNISIVIRPFATKTYAKGDFDKMFQIVFFSSKIYYSINLCMTIVLVFLAEIVLQLWLGKVPEYSVEFVCLILIYMLIRSLNSPLHMLFTASGRIREYQIGEGIIIALPLLASYLLLYYGAPFYSTFLTMNISAALDVAFMVILANKQCQLSISQYVYKVVVRLTPATIIPCFVYIILITHEYNLYSKVTIAVVTCLASLLMTYMFGFDKEERNILKSIIKRK